MPASLQAYKGKKICISPGKYATQRLNPFNDTPSEFEWLLADSIAAAA
eukprot:CAMPEP_0169288416 /NCGR_PEP_ID=MMETSP1016-20121227/60545_1 /TAXON_ID=342587 /ORGANISM="Karlodinium micrum, Strain CCMP2283" /LENGTH=47 /DNA_ID= /DNA_START= /DNA_END= /DNA_ORIENTATION=